MREVRIDSKRVWSSAAREPRLPVESCFSVCLTWSSMASAVLASFSVRDSDCLASTRRTAGRWMRAAARRRVRLMEPLPAPNSCSSSTCASWSTRRSVSPTSIAFAGCDMASSSCNAAARTVSPEASCETS
eukprot:3251927-Prymnesium_polylepis.1